MIKSAELLTPLLNIMNEKIIESSLICMDETRIQVLKESGKSLTSDKYMWVRVRGSTDEPLVIFDYDPSRSGKVAARLLDDFNGYLMTDGFGGYGKIGSSESIIHCGCWDHARRRFYDAVSPSAYVVVFNLLAFYRWSKNCF